MSKRIVWTFVWTAAVLWTAAGPARAQLQAGSLYGTVLDPEQSPLPGASVTLSGIGAPQTQVTDEKGRFRFISLPPGSYQLAANLDGFSPVEHTGLIIHVGRSTDVEVVLAPAVADTVTVNAEAPLLDERRFTRGNTFTLTELERVPTARDPWSVIETTPGVLMDRFNVGGSETGTQARIVGPGSTAEQVVWTLDGMVITDMTNLGNAPGMFDFDSFEEIEVTTGGSDASNSSSGVVLNMVTKRGTNDWRASGRFFYSNHDLRSDLEVDADDLGKPGPWNNNRGQSTLTQGNRIESLRDYGVEAGGPVVRDHAWIWGSWADPEIEKRTIDDYVETENLTAWNLKLNAQVTPANSATAFAWDDEKVKRGLGASPLRPQESTWNQSDFGAEPTAWKLEDSHIFGPSFYLTAFYSRVNAGFSRLPQGGEKVPYQDGDLVWHNSYFLSTRERPQDQVQADAASFFDTGRWSHELKYGAGYREVEQFSLYHIPAGGWELGPEGLLFLSRDGQSNIRGRYASAFLQDTVSSGRLTANLGLRWDRQSGRNLPTSIAANPVRPDLLPAADYAGSDAGFTWNDIVPRLGLTWSLGEKRDTLLRASYSRYADQLGTRYLGWTNPLLEPGYQYMYTTNGGGPSLEPSELGPALAVSSNVHPLTFGPLVSNAVDPDLKAPLTDEILVGVEHSVSPDFLIGLQASYRHFSRILDQTTLVFDGNARSPENLARTGRAHRPDDYVPGRQVTVTAPDGRSYTVTPWELRPGVSTRGGVLLENGDREQDYKGLFLTYHKRLTGRWMSRGHVSWQDWRWDIPDGAVADPTGTVAGGVEDGDEVLQGREAVGPANKGYAYIGSGWSYAFTGLYRIAPERPWGFNVAASLHGREGYPLRYTQRLVRRTVATRATDIPLDGDFSHPDVHVVDLRVDRDFTFRNVGLTLGVEVFNALNEATVLQRSLILGNSRSDHVTEVLSPRIWRLGLRFHWR